MEKTWPSMLLQPDIDKDMPPKLYTFRKVTNTSARKYLKTAPRQNLVLKSLLLLYILHSL